MSSCLSSSLTFVTLSWHSKQRFEKERSFSTNSSANLALSIASLKPFKLFMFPYAFLFQLDYQGFAFVSYLAQRFGTQVLEDISRRMSAPLSVSISRAMKKATGSDGRQLYREWKVQLEDRYGQEMMNVQAHRVMGDILVDQGTTNLHPVWHPSDRKFAFLSNREWRA